MHRMPTIREHDRFRARELLVAVQEGAKPQVFFPSFPVRNSLLETWESIPGLALPLCPSLGTHSVHCWAEDSEWKSLYAGPTQRFLCDPYPAYYLVALTQNGLTNAQLSHKNTVTCSSFFYCRSTELVKSLLITALLQHTRLSATDIHDCLTNSDKISYYDWTNLCSSSLPLCKLPDQTYTTAEAIIISWRKQK